jgi:hypothetical protein
MAMLIINAPVISGGRIFFSKSASVSLSNDVPNYSGYPLRFMARLLASGLAILLRR